MGKIHTVSAIRDDYGSEGWGFESLRACHVYFPLFYCLLGASDSLKKREFFMFVSQIVSHWAEYEGIARNSRALKTPVI